MYEIIFYQDTKGNSDVVNFIRQLQHSSKTSKEKRIYLNKVVAYLDMLAEMGTRVGQPVTKHLDGEIWELRPLRSRILYAYYEDNKFIILHYFMKKTRKTPKREIEIAKHNLQDYLERNG